jgi:hypothetical protein
MAGDHVGILIDLEQGTLLFFKNGVKNGPGWSDADNKVTGPLVLAMQCGGELDSAQLLPDAEWPAQDNGTAQNGTSTDANPPAFPLDCT